MGGGGGGDETTVTDTRGSLAPSADGSLPARLFTRNSSAEKFSDSEENLTTKNRRLECCITSRMKGGGRWTNSRKPLGFRMLCR